MNLVTSWSSPLSYLAKIPDPRCSRLWKTLGVLRHDGLIADVNDPPVSKTDQETSRWMVVSDDLTHYIA